MNTQQSKPQLQAPRGVQLRLLRQDEPEEHTAASDTASLLAASRAALAFLDGRFADVDPAFAPREPLMSAEDRAYYEREGRQPLPKVPNARSVETHVRRMLEDAIAGEEEAQRVVREAIEEAVPPGGVPAWRTTLAGAAAITVRAPGPWEALDALVASLPPEMRSAMVSGASTRDRIQGTLGGQPFTIEKEAGSARSGGAR